MKRTFTTEYLDSLELPGGGFAVHTKQIDERRWATVHHLVFKTDEGDDRLWSVAYYRPASENQEGQGEPWGYGHSPETVEATEVKAVTELVEVTKYVPTDVAMREVAKHEYAVEAYSTTRGWFLPAQPRNGRAAIFPALAEAVDYQRKWWLGDTSRIVTRRVTEWEALDS